MRLTSQQAGLSSQRGRWHSLEGRNRHWGGFTFAVPSTEILTVCAILCISVGYRRGSLRRRGIELSHPIGGFATRVEKPSNMLDSGASIA
jgi:hypothetical protein